MHDRILQHLRLKNVFITFLKLQSSADFIKSNFLKIVFIIRTWKLDNNLNTNVDFACSIAGASDLNIY